MSPSGEREYFILICTDTERVDGDFFPAIEVAMARMRKHAWPLYEHTKNRRRLGAGDNCIVYLAGDSAARQTVIATAEVLAIRPCTAHERALDDTSLLVDPPAHLVLLGAVREFARPIPIAGLLTRLSFVPSNLAKWGSVMQGGCRRIPQHDFDLLTSAGRAEQ